MTKQEYLVGRGEIYRSKDNYYRKKLRYSKLKDEYISSLEADVEQLKADNLDLMKQVEVNGRALDMACEIAANGCPESYKECKYPDESLSKANEVGCLQCWKEYYLKKAGE